MNFEQMIKLIDAGFTKEDIMKIIAADPANAVNNNSSAPEPEAGSPAASTASDVPQAPAAPAAPAGTTPAGEPDIYQMISDKIDAKFNEMAEAMRMPAMPSMGEIKPLGIDDIVRKFFKED